MKMHWSFNAGTREKGLFATLFLLPLTLLCGMAYGVDLDSVPTEAAAVLDDRYPVREVSFDNGVSSLADVVYAQPAGFQPQKLDIYMPDSSGDSDSRYPLVLMIHGGGWMSGHSRHSGAFADWPGTMAAMAEDGYVIASINYRLSGEAPFPAAIQDVKSAILFLKAHAEQYHIDPERIITWGGSAGGQLAALASVSCGVEELAPTAAIPGWDASMGLSDCVQGSVVWYGVFDFLSMLDGQVIAAPPVANYLDCSPECAMDNVRLASAIALLDENDPPMILIHGVDDGVVPVWQSEQFHAEAGKVGVKTEMILIPGVNHSFVGPDYQTTRDASLQALGASLEFLESLFPE